MPSKYPVRPKEQAERAAKQEFIRSLFVGRTVTDVEVADWTVDSGYDEAVDTLTFTLDNGRVVNVTVDGAWADALWLEIFTDDEGVTHG